MSERTVNISAAVVRTALCFVSAMTATVPVRAEPAAVHRIEFLASACRAFHRRVDWIRSARSSVDITSYHWRDDTIGRYFAAELIRAADRGIRVRILIDAWRALEGMNVLSYLNGHPLISVRLYNPPVTVPSIDRRADDLPFSRSLAWFIRLNTRLHQKLMLVDGRRMIIGGRNWTDEYYRLDERLNFFDVDLAVEGPSAQRARRIFEHVWSQPLSVSLRRLPGLFMRSSGKILPDDDRLEGMERCADREVASPLDSVTLSTQAPVEYWYTDPFQEEQSRRAIRMWTAFVFDGIANRRRLLVTPYFYPPERIKPHGEWIVVTNSWDSAPSRWAQTFCDDRFEHMRSVRHASLKRYVPVASGPAPRTAVHAKIYIVANKGVFIGSANADPRSLLWNLENGVFIKDPDAARLLFSRWRLLLRDPGRFMEWDDAAALSGHHDGIWLRRLILFLGKFTIPLI